jgi:GNAT superfamily N-acetyltransferase
MAVVEAWTPAGHAALGRPDLDVVRRLETVSARSWPALETASLGGWQLRAAGGVTRRINSAWPRAGSTLTVDQLLRATESWYTARGLLPRIQLSPANEPADLAEHLLDPASGWSIGGETLVLTGPVGGAPHPAVEVSPVLTEDWFRVASITAGKHFGGGLEATGRAVLQGISTTCAYAVAAVDGDPVAVGRAVADGDDVGVFSMGTLPERRGEGHARRVLDALRQWAADQGASRLWLAVDADNTAALALYGGMTPAFTYAYATKD